MEIIKKYNFDVFCKTKNLVKLRPRKSLDKISRPTFRISNFPIPNLIKPQNRLIEVLKTFFLVFPIRYLLLSLSSLIYLSPIRTPPNPEREIVEMSVSSSTTGGRRRVRTPGIPNKCWCGVGITELISKTNQNPYRRYYRCIYAASLRVHPFRFCY